MSSPPILTDEEVTEMRAADRPWRHRIAARMKGNKNARGKLMRRYAYRPSVNISSKRAALIAAGNFMLEYDWSSGGRVGISTNDPERAATWVAKARGLGYAVRDAAPKPVNIASANSTIRQGPRNESDRQYDAREGGFAPPPRECPSRPADGCCQYCHAPVGIEALVMDHNHGTGEFCAWCCRGCNVRITDKNRSQMVASLVHAPPDIDEELCPGHVGSEADPNGVHIDKEPWE